MEQFLSGLTGYYLFAALNEVLYNALVAENRWRHAHMDGALNKLAEYSAHLRLACNAQRQEEIGLPRKWRSSCFRRGCWKNSDWENGLLKWTRAKFQKLEFRVIRCISLLLGVILCKDAGI